MADEEYNKKLQCLQQYIPFLNNMIQQLKDPRMKNREQQLQKLVSLHSMITDKKKKLKLETLVKCEDVILKLFHKVKSGSHHQPNIQPRQMPLPQPISTPPMMAPPSTKIIPETPASPPITPSSPSPPPMMPQIKPVVIPTEKIPEERKDERPHLQSFSSSSSVKQKIDIYSKAADSLNKVPEPKTKPSVFSRLGCQPDMSKPPISIEDLKVLDENQDSPPTGGGGDPDNMSLNELTDLREKLQRKLSKESPSKKDTTKRSDKSPIRLPSPEVLASKKSLKVVINSSSENENIPERQVILENDKPNNSESKPKHEIMKIDESKSKDHKIKDRSNSHDHKSKDSNKPKEKTASPDKNDNKDKSVKIATKVVKECDNIFASTLSSIDNKILEGVTHHKKRDERTSSSSSSKDGKEKKDDKSAISKDKKSSRHSSSNKEKHEQKEHRSSKDDKKSETSSSKDKSERRSSSDTKNKEKKDSKSESSSKDRKDHKSSERRSSSDSSSKNKEKSDKKPKDDKKDIKIKDDPRKEKKDVHEKSGSKDHTSIEKLKVDKVIKSEQLEKPETTENKINEVVKTEPPVYKRLADKYNPKPRKISIDNEPIKQSSASIPFLESTSQKNIASQPLNTNLTPVTSDKKSFTTQSDVLIPQLNEILSKTNNVQSINQVVPPVVQNNFPHSSLLPQTPQFQKEQFSSPSYQQQNVYQQQQLPLTNTYPVNKELPFNHPNFNPGNQFLHNQHLQNINQSSRKPPLLNQPLLSPNQRQDTFPNRFQPSPQFNQFDRDQQQHFHPNQFNNPVLSPPFDHPRNNFPDPRGVIPPPNRREDHYDGGEWRTEVVDRRIDTRFNSDYRNQRRFSDRDQDMRYMDYRLGNNYRGDIDMRFQDHHQHPQQQQQRFEDRDMRDYNNFDPRLPPRNDPRVNREDPRMHREDQRLNREDPRMNREDLRLNREDPRMNREDQRLNREDPRMNREDQRLNREDPRMNREDQRLNREDQRLNREDQRLNREDQRLNREDQRLNRDDPRLSRDDRRLSSDEPRIVHRDDDRTKISQLGQSRDMNRSSSSSNHRERESRFRYRDPRVNRYQNSSKDRSRSRSRSQSRENDSSFSSPLDSLYYGDSSSQKTGKGYGVQNFRIPKIKKQDESAETSTNNENNQNELSTTNTTSNEIESKADSTTTEIDKIEPQQSNNNKNKDNIDGQQKELENEITSSSSLVENDENDVKENVKKIDETEIINQFLKNLLENEKTRTAASIFIDNVTNSLNDEKLKMVVETVKSAKLLDTGENQQQSTSTTKIEKEEEEQQEQQEPEPEEEVDEEEEEEEEEEDEDEDEKTVKTKESSKTSVKTTTKKRKRPIIATKKKKKKVEDNNKKNKKGKNVTTTVQQKPKRHRSELDLLHEDIHDMFIRDGVLTATGKRMCRLLTEEKQQEAKNAAAEIVQNRPKRNNNNNKTNDKTDTTTTTTTEKLKEMSNVKVVLPKLIIDEDKRYSLRNNQKNVSYTDNSDNEEEQKTTKRQRSINKEEEDDENDLKNEEEIPPADSDVSSEISEKTNEKQTVVKKVKKRSRGWAAGIIPKKKRMSDRIRSDDNNKEIEKEEDETTKDTKVETIDNKNEKIEEPEEEKIKKIEDILPDINYYSTNENKSRLSCKLCNFVGVNISNHYVSEHPNTEVLSSRMPPEKAKIAIDESIAQNLDEIDGFETLNIGSNHFTFECRFCDHKSISNCLGLFYDHLSTHTGEFRHKCNICTFTASNRKRLRLHFDRIHENSDEALKYNTLTIIKHKLQGYICNKCNFVQMNYDNVFKHMELYHKKCDDKKIYKINLASKFEEKRKIGETTKSTKTQKRPIKRKMYDDDDDDDLEQDDDKNSTTGTTPQNDEVLKKKVKTEKEIDMNVFTCNSDIFDDDDNKIEEERLKTMSEVNDVVKINRQSRSFLDELTNRLKLEEEDNNKTREESDEDIKIKEETTTGENRLQTGSKKLSTKTQEIVKPSTVEIVEKQNISICGMIEKLRTILKEEPTDVAKAFDDESQSSQDDIENDEKPVLNKIIEEEVAETESLLSGEYPPPPLTPLKRLSCESNVILSAGFLNINKDEYGLEYHCRVPSCLYKSRDRDIFVNHWSNDHKPLNLSCKIAICKICNIHIEATNQPILIKFFEHIENSHKDILTTHQEPQLATLKLRRFSSDILSKESPMTTLEINDNDFDQNIEDIDLTLEEDNPFPFKISAIMSLASSDSKPDLEPKQKTPPKKFVTSILLKEHKATKSEEYTLRNRYIPEKYLKTPQDLYKCPIIDCLFTTNKRSVFDVHCNKNHPNGDAFCVYCNIQTPIVQAGLHIDFRHSQCTYACSKCLYRAVRKEYVIIHMKNKHKKCNIIYSSPICNKVLMKSRTKVYTLEEIAIPYVCKGCDKNFMFEKEFVTHLQDYHANDQIYSCNFLLKSVQCTSKFPSIDSLIAHYRLHMGVRYYCLLCKFRTPYLASLLRHYSCLHPSHDLKIADRSGMSSNLEDATLRSTDQSGFKIISVGTLTESNNLEITEPSLPPLITIDSSSNVSDIDSSNVEGDNDDDELSSVEMDPLTIETDSNSQIDATNSDVVVAPAATAAATAAAASTVTATASSSGATGGYDSDSQEVSELIHKDCFGLSGYQLYKCAFCDISFLTSKDFKIHCINSKLCQDPKNKSKPFRCVHCSRTFRNAHGLLEHINYHGPLRFNCSLCVRKFPSCYSLKVHMRIKHSVTETLMTPLVSSRKDLDRDEFILRPKQFEANISEDDTDLTMKNSTNQVEYGPDEIDSLPKRHIFTSVVKCSLCSYNTKVRTNLIRHLQFHIDEKSVPDIAPVNPVPCLDKNEKMFDKMTNLAISSFTGGRMGGNAPKTEPKVEESLELPGYVPLNRRYVCCAQNCSYLSIDESTFRHHLYALHDLETSFSCVHCKKELKADVDQFIKHLKLHDSHLYKCAYCKFIHNLKHKVEKHSSEKHLDKAIKVITIRSMETELLEIDSLTANQQQQQLQQQAQSTSSSESTSSTIPGGGGNNGNTNIKYTKPWHCGMCKYRCAAKNDVISHILNKHNMNAQYKCTLCTYITNEKCTFDEHFKENHPDNSIDIIHIYYKSDVNKVTGVDSKQFDTTPLWQRDRPRVRHIRGILFEESPKPTKKYTKEKEKEKNIVITHPPLPPPPPSTTSTLSSIDSSIEAVVSNMSMDKMDDDIIISEENKDTTSIIVIEDDENDVDVVNATTPPRLVIDEGTEIKTEETENLLTLLEATNELDNKISEDVLVSKFGKLGKALGKFYVCPKCTKYTTKKIENFIYHLLNDLKINRFSCDACNYSDITYDSMMNHCEVQHNNSSGINKLDLPEFLIFWLEIIVYRQTEHIVRTMIAEGLIQEGVNQLSSQFRVYCRGCNKWFKNIRVMKNHELTHYLEEKYVCSLCNHEEKDLLKYFEHTNMAHPSETPILKKRNYSVESLLETLTNPSNILTTSGGVTSGGLQQQQQQSSSGGGVTGDDYLCFYCAETKKTINDLHDHWKEKHKPNNMSFSYKIVRKLKNDLYCCAYCHEKDNKDALVEHHKQQHPDLKFDVYLFICLECSSTYLTVGDLRSHFVKQHYGKKLTYCEIERKVPPHDRYDIYPCPKCPFRSTTTGGIRMHLRKHLRPIDCNLCNATFVTLSEARLHSQKDHPNETAAIKDNDERIKELGDLTKESLAKKFVKVKEEKPPTSPKPVVVEPPRKNVAKKSTGAPQHKPPPPVIEYQNIAGKDDDDDDDSFGLTIAEDEDLSDIQTTEEK